MVRDQLPGLTPAWLISLAMVLGTTIVVLLPVSISGGDAIKASDWIGFAGNVLAGVMTLIAASVAWFAVQQQIKVQLDLEKQRTEHEQEKLRLTQENAKEVGSMALSQSVHAATGVLISIRRILSETDPEVVSKWERALDRSFLQLDLMLSRFSFAEITSEMNINDKLIYLAVISRFKSIVALHQHPVGIISRRDELETAESQFVGVEYYLGLFDQELEAVFKRDAAIS